MEFDAEVLEEKIECYFRGEISQKDLGRWASTAYYDILRGGYVENKKVVIYPFLKIISTFHVEENDKEDVFPCSEDDVEKVRDILKGTIDFDFDIEMSIPTKLFDMFKEKKCFDMRKREIFKELRSEITKCVKQKGIIRNEIIVELKKTMSTACPIRTIQDFLEKDIIKLLKMVYVDEFAEICDKKTEYYKLYAQKSKDNLLLVRLIDYLDSYIGYKNFHLFVSFKKGVHHLFILV